MRIVVVAILLAILASLMAALVFLFRDEGHGTRMAHVLTWRIGLSVLLFALLILGFLSGIIPPGGSAVPP
jgi:hypothetical protein